MADNTIESHKELVAFSNRLITTLEKSDTITSLTIENLLEAVCTALQAEWAGIINPVDEWKPLHCTHNWPERFPTKKQIDFFESHPMLKKRPFSLESEKDLSSLGLNGALNVAIVPIKWALVPGKSWFLIIGNKTKKLNSADDLPYYTLPLLRIIALLFTLTSGVVVVNRLMYLSEKSWEQALLSGSRSEIKNRARELKSFLSGEEERLYDEVEASLLDASLSLEIAPTRRIHDNSEVAKRG